MIPALFAAALHLSACNIAGAAARCGTFDVPEAADSMRTLHLKLIILPATERNDSPIFPFAGGPGDIVTGSASFIVREVVAERRHHDYVLLDQRGTEGSARCPKAVKSHERELIEDDLFPPRFIADCRREVEAKADPRHLTTEDFVDDVEALRKALGYGPINIIGLSYGTRAALTFEARHPQSVRSIVMYGPLAIENRLPLEFGRDAQSVLDIIFPDQKELRKALASLPRDINSGHYTIHMTPGAFAEYLRTKLYTVAAQKEIPEIVRNASAGNWGAITPGFVRYRKGWYDDIGVYLSVACPMDTRYISPAEIAPETAGTFGGDYRVRRQIAACAQWTPGIAPRITVAKDGAPILIFVGDLDAVTATRWIHAPSLSIPRVQSVVVSNAGHGDFGDCELGIETAFFERGTFDRLDTSCAQKP